MKPIPWAKPSLVGKGREYVLDALDSTWISGGPYVDRLERDFLRANSARYGLSVCNGTTAVHLAFLALDIGPGDEVIVPGFTFSAPANMAISVGAKPVYADVHSETWCIDPAAIEKAITRRTRAIVAVHIYGNVCDMAPIQRIARKHGVALVEDAAEAAFSKYRGKYAGTMGDLGTFSFQATKTITTGEGGFVITRRAGLLDKMRRIRDHGMRKKKKYWHDLVGYNFRLTNLQAALGCAQLERLPRLIRARRAMHKTYQECLAGQEGVELQRFAPAVDPVVWAIVLKLDPRRFKMSRDAVMARLLKSGIETRPGFYSFRDMPPYRAPRLRVAEDICRQAISLPSFPALTEREIRFSCRKLLDLRS